MNADDKLDNKLKDLNKNWRNKKLKRWFITVDWCNKNKRGIFCSRDGGTFGNDSQHTPDDMWEILGAFAMILNPQSIELTEEELKEYHRWYPLEEYSNEYGICCKD